MKRRIALSLALLMILTLLPAETFAQLGAMTRGTPVRAGYKMGHYYLANDYLGFYIDEFNGGRKTFPAQFSPSQIMAIPYYTETDLFYINDSGFGGNYKTLPTYKNESKIEVKGSTLVQTRDCADNGVILETTYELVQMDNGTQSGNVPVLIGKNPNDPGTAWGVLAITKVRPRPGDTRPFMQVRWAMHHRDFAKAGHGGQGAVKLGQMRYVRDPYVSARDYCALSNSNISFGVQKHRTSLKDTEVYTDTFPYANSFVALDSYGYTGGLINGVEVQDGGIHGWYGSHFGESLYYGNTAYNLPGEKDVVVEQTSGGIGTLAPGSTIDVGRESKMAMLWGYRDLVKNGQNVPPDPAVLLPDANCVGFVNQNGVLQAMLGSNPEVMKGQYGDALLGTMMGSVREDTVTGEFVFGQNGAQLTPTLMATWRPAEGGSLRVKKDGTILAKKVSLSTPQFKIFQPIGTDGIDLHYKKEHVEIDVEATKNEALLYMDIPYATSEVNKILAGYDGNLTLKGELSIHSLFLDAANLEITRLGLGPDGQGGFQFKGVEAKGAVDMQQLLGMDVGSAAADINSFKGPDEHYSMELNIKVEGLFETEAKLVLKRITNGALIPNDLYLYGKVEKGIDLVPPVIIGELNGGGGGFFNLADTINGEYIFIPPLKLKLTGAGKLLQILEGRASTTIGPGYFENSLDEVKLLKVANIVKNCRWYVSMQGENNYYESSLYQGLRLGGGMEINLGVPSVENAWIEAGGYFNASGFGGWNDNKTWIYLQIGADGKIYGVVKVPAKKIIGTDIHLLSAELDFALGGQTAFPIRNTDFNNAIKQAVENISVQGGVAYTGNFLGLPYRIYYIIQEKKPGIQTGKLFGKMEPFKPMGSSRSMALMDADTGEQVGIMVFGDNLSMTSLGGRGPQTEGVLIQEKDATHRLYKATIEDTAPSTQYLAFVLQPEDGYTGTMEDFLQQITIAEGDHTWSSAGGSTTSGSATGITTASSLDITSGSSLTLVPAVIGKDANNNDIITNEATANVLVGEDRLTVKLPKKGIWTFAGGDTPFDISCLYAQPFAKWVDSEMQFIHTGAPAFTGTIHGEIGDYDTSKNYVLRTYLGDTMGDTHYLLSQEEVSGAAVQTTVSLKGGAAKTGDYYPTCVLLEEVTGDFDGDPSTPEDSGYVTVDTHAFGGKVGYFNELQPEAPRGLSVASIGSETLKVSWTPPMDQSKVDSYLIKIYKKDAKGNWVESGNNRKIQALDEKGQNVTTVELPITIGGEDAKEGGESLALPPDAFYRVGILAAHHTLDQDNDGKMEGGPVYSAEILSEDSGVFLKKAEYPRITYVTHPLLLQEEKNQVKTLSIHGGESISIQTDMPCTMQVYRMDKEEEIAATFPGATESGYTLPGDFEGSLMLKILAKNQEGDLSVDYLLLEKDQQAPSLYLDQGVYFINENGEFSITGSSEAGAVVALAEGVPGVTMEKNEIMADTDGRFTLKGRMTLQAGEEVQAFLPLEAKDSRGNPSNRENATVMSPMKDVSQVAPLQVNPESKDFGSQIQGYEGVPAQTFTITAGEGSFIQNLKVSSDTVNGVYTIGSISKTGLAPGETATFTVNPQKGLPPGDYPEELKISADGIVPQPLSVSFHVTALSQETYTLTVTGGSGSGNYKQGVEVHVMANPPEVGQRFKGWKVEKGPIALPDLNKRDITFTMPGQDAALTALYEKDSDLNPPIPNPPGPTPPGPTPPGPTPPGPNPPGPTPPIPNPPGPTPPGPTPPGPNPPGPNPSGGFDAGWSTGGTEAAPQDSSPQEKKEEVPPRAPETQDTTTQTKRQRAVEFILGSTTYYDIVDGTRIQEREMDVAPMLVNNRAMLPMRYVAEALGMELQYDSKTRTATFVHGEIVVKLPIDSNTLYKNGEALAMDAPPVNVNNRILLSITNVAKAFGKSSGTAGDGRDADILWIPERKAVQIRQR